MSKYNEKNERIKKEYDEYLEESQGKNEKTIDQVRDSIYRFEEYNKFKDLATFKKEQAIGFKKYLSKQKAKKDGKNLSKSTLLHISTNLKHFFYWLSEQKGYSKIKKTDIEYLNLLDNDIRAVRNKKIKFPPTPEQIRKVVFGFDSSNEIAKHHQALIAFTFLTGARDLAISSLKIKHIDLHRRIVTQDPKDGVKTKGSKLIYTKFFPIGKDIENIVVNWVNYLIKEKLFSQSDPLFPKIKIGHDQNKNFQAQGLSKEQWADASRIRKIFQDSFEKENLPYFNPHSFRDTLSEIGKNSCNIAQYKAWSQNLGHENISTTLDNYGKMDVHRQFELIDNIKELNKSNCFDY